NDAFLGLPHDIFCFTMLQEIIARSLDVHLGSYKHMVGSLHVYEAAIPKVRRFLNEGWQSTSAMQPMPAGNPWPPIKSLLQIERLVRTGNRFATRLSGLAPYWADVARLLLAFKHYKTQDSAAVVRLRHEMDSQVFDVFLDDKSAACTLRSSPQ